MNSYKWISIGQVVGRVVRRAGLKDTSLIPDLHEWAAEALGIIQFTDVLQSDYEENMEVIFHKVKKPCGMRELLAVEYCGTRLPLGTSSKDPRSSIPYEPYRPYIEDAVFVSGVTVQDTPNGNNTFIGVIEKVNKLPWNDCHWYKDDGNYIITSFADGKISMYFNRTPVDHKGFLQIPDEGNLKESITWFLLHALAGRGYNTSQYSQREMYDKFELFAGRAKEIITFPTLDKAEATLEHLVQLMPSTNYYESFFR